MATQISLQATLKLVNGDLNDPGPNLGTITVIQIGAQLWKIKLTLVAGTDTDIGALINNISGANLGIAYFVNTDPTNYVDWGPASGGAIVAAGRLLPNDIPHIVRLTPSMDLHMKAHTGNCDVIICVYQA